MKKTKPKYDDGLEWLREVRRKIWDECDHDLDKLMAHYRQIHQEETARRAAQTAVLQDKKS